MQTIKYKFSRGVWAMAVYEGSDDLFIGVIMAYDYDQSGSPMYLLKCGGTLSVHYEWAVKVLV